MLQTSKLEVTRFLKDVTNVIKNVINDIKDATNFLKNVTDLLKDVTDIAFVEGSTKLSLGHSLEDDLVYRDLGGRSSRRRFVVDVVVDQVAGGQGRLLQDGFLQFGCFESSVRFQDRSHRNL
jgi:hypothetical protein